MNLNLAEENKNQKFEKISADIVISVGEACRPSCHLREHKKRFLSSPLDWMMGYNLGSVLNLFKNDFSDFFENIVEFKSVTTSQHRTVKDTKNGVISLHHFGKADSLENEQIKFISLMHKRWKKLKQCFQKADSILFICNRKDAKLSELKKFIVGVSKIYKDTKISLINIVDDENSKGIEQKKLFSKGNLKIVQFKFSDRPLPNKDGVVVPSWKGNKEYWKQVMDCIDLSTKFTAKVDFTTVPMD